MLSLIAGILTAAVIGAAAAFCGILFIDGAAAAGALAHAAPALTLFLPVAAGALCAFIARFLPGGVFLGLADTVLLAQRDVRHRFRHGVLAAGASFAALAGGASVGQYGPIAHLGGLLGGLCRARLPRADAAACGVAAAIAAAFNAPLTGLLFAHEVVLRGYSPRAFMAVAVAAVTGYSVSKGVFERADFLQIESMTTLHPAAVGWFIALGVVFGVLAKYYTRAIFWLADITARAPLAWRLPAAGLAAGLLALWRPEITGGGKPLLEAAAGGMPAAEAAALLAAKGLATLICLGAGFAGGVVSPTLAVGALAGLLLFEAAGGLIAALPAAVPVSAAVLCAMMALTAPVIGAPLTGILFVMELSGSYSAGVAAVVSIAVSVRVAAMLGGRSYYDRQLLRRGFDIPAFFGERAGG